MVEPQVAVFIDFENVAITAEEVYGKCDLSVIMATAEQWGRCTIRRAYCDWTGFSQYQQDLIVSNHELNQEKHIHMLHPFHWNLHERY